MDISNLKPYRFLIIAMIISELLLMIWMGYVAEKPTNERIVVGSLSIAVLIAVLVVYSVITWMITNSKIEDTKMKHDLGNHGIGDTIEKDAISKWPERLLYYDTGSKLWYYNSDDNAPNSVTWTEVKYDKLEKESS